MKSPLLNLLALGGVLGLSCGVAVARTQVAPTTSFRNFDRRARAGERLSVVFFGASLTWGANASDPQQTSYRADVSRRFEAAYPKAHFKFWDAAIGGTGSQLGVFRMQRDVLRHHPDLVFLDFSANDAATAAACKYLQPAWMQAWRIRSKSSLFSLRTALRSFAWKVFAWPEARPWCRRLKAHHK